MKNFELILKALGYGIRKHNRGYELRHIDTANRHPELKGKALLPFYEQDLESVAIFIASKLNSHNLVKRESKINTDPDTRFSSPHVYKKPSGHWITRFGALPFPTKQ